MWLFPTNFSFSSIFLIFNLHLQKSLLHGCECFFIYLKNSLELFKRVCPIEVWGHVVTYCTWTKSIMRWAGPIPILLREVDRHSLHPRMNSWWRLCLSTSEKRIAQSVKMWTLSSFKRNCRRRSCLGYFYLVLKLLLFPGNFRETKIDCGK